MVVAGSFFSVSAQTLKSDIRLSFVKDSATVSGNELHFNTLKIWNTSARAYEGTLVFTGPANWRVISFNASQVTIQAGDTLWIPVRVSCSPDATGAITYLVHGSFRVAGNSVTTTTYLTVPPISKWDFQTFSSSSYITENYPYTSFLLKLRNLGNTHELIRLDYKLGKILTFRTDAENHSPVEYVSLLPYKDTTITRTITLQQNLSYAERLRYERNWKESAIALSASTEMLKKTSEIQIKKLSSSYNHLRAQTNSPLNFDYNIYNLMSNQLPRSNLNVYGNILFQGSSEIQYNVGFQNMNFQKDQVFDFDRQIIYNLRYIDTRSNILLSYNTYTGGLHSINGRGISGNFEINKLHKISYSFIQNPFTNDMGGSVGYETRIKGVSVNTQFTQEFNPFDGYSASSVLGGARFTIFKFHRFNVNLLGSYASYKNINGRDTSALGMSYRFNYSVKYKNFDLYLNGINTSLNRIKNAGNQQYYLDSRYSFSDKLRLVMYGSLLNYSTTRYPYNFDHPTNINSTEYVRFALSYSMNDIVYQLGPNYVGSTRKSLNSFTGFTTKFMTYQPGIWGSATFRLDGYRSVSPNITLGKMIVNYSSSNPAIPDMLINNGFAYSLGVNYFDENFKLNAYYSSGSASDLYRDYQIYEQPSLTRSLQIRPSYENYVFNRTGKVIAHVNYAYYLPTERQNIAYNARYEHYMKDQWRVYLNGALFSNSRKDESGNRINTLDMNVIIGVSKTFDIQQPRLKYYNLKTVFFNDMDGDRFKSENEPPVSNIMVNISRDKNETESHSNLPVLELISNVNGEVNISNMPKDKYIMTYQPLINLQSYYFLNGSEQAYYSDKDRVLYVPLVESYKIKGKVNLVRDPNSTEGLLSLDGIRIEAHSKNGEVYSVLTDSHGEYILNVPNADIYTVKIRNTFGEHFMLDNDEVVIQFSKNKTINLDFNFVEKKREINFNNGNQIFKFSTN